LITNQFRRNQIVSRAIPPDYSWARQESTDKFNYKSKYLAWLAGLYWLYL